MKKIILTVIATMIMTMGFAKTQNETAVKNVENYGITFDLRRLAVTLDLDSYQMEAAQVIYDNLNNDLSAAATARWHERPALTREAISKDISHMKTILNDKQFDKYMKLFGATLQNKFLRR